MDMQLPPSKQSGFTLIELVVVIVVLGIVSIGMSGIIRQAMDSVITVSEREDLVREGSFLTERFNRELSAAVPNSVRIMGNALVHCIEFVPAKSSGTYLSLPLDGGASDTADIVLRADIQGNVFVPSTSDFAIVYPTNAAQVYNTNANHRQAVLSCTDDGADSDCSTLDDADSVVQLQVSGGFAETSPSRRMYFAHQAVSYCMRGGEVYRHVSNINETQSLFTVNGSLMAKNVVNQLTPNPATGLQSPFKSIGATFNRNAATQSLFIFGREDERVTFMQEVQIPNVP
jgi:MSHA biogenesis protein MshO